jgi:hypothetical protein
MRSSNRIARIDDDATLDVRKPEPASEADDWLAAGPGAIGVVIFGVTLIVDAVLFLVSMFFAATIFLAVVSLILLYVCCGLTTLLCGIGALISLIGAICALRKPTGLTINLISFFANASAVGLAWWLLSFLLANFK